MTDKDKLTKGPTRGGEEKEESGELVQLRGGKERGQNKEARERQRGQDAEIKRAWWTRKITQRLNWLE